MSYGGGDGGAKRDIVPEMRGSKGARAQLRNNHLLLRAALVIKSCTWKIGQMYRLFTSVTGEMQASRGHLTKVYNHDFIYRVYFHTPGS